MKPLTKAGLVVGAIFLVCLAGFGALAYRSYLGLRDWSRAEVNHLEPARYVNPATDRIISKPDEPMLIEEMDGGYRLYGTASWYNYTFNEDWSSRVCFIDREDCYTQDHNVAAMRLVPRGTTVKVTRLDNKKSVEVLITDYGPDGDIYPARVIDLSSKAFAALGDLDRGLFEVMVEWE